MTAASCARSTPAMPRQIAAAGPRSLVGQHLLHQLVEHLFDFELAEHRQVRARSARGTADLAVAVRQQAHGFRSTGIDSEHEHWQSGNYPVGGGVLWMGKAA